MKKTVLTILGLFFLGGAVWGEPPATQGDTLVAVPRRPLVAVAEALAVNGAVWSFNYFIREDNYSFQIGWRTVEANLRHGMEWDPNKFKVNFFDHPFHGSIYFNAARTNGFNFWESAPFAFGGSLMWEFFMESEYPSYNDLIMTTFGGIALGESFYRLSEQILDDRATGFNRVWREFTALVINPIGGFNRLVSGAMFRRDHRVNHMRFPLRGYFSLGTSGRVSGTAIEQTSLNPALEVTMHYGKPFEEKRHRKPFDYFTFRLWTSQGNGEERNLTIFARANLIGKHLESGQNQKHLLGISQQYDFVNLDVIKIGSMSFGPELLSSFPLGKNFTLITGPYLGAIILGAGDNEYVESYQGRNYNYGWGFKGKMDVKLIHPQLGRLYVDYSYFYIDSREGAPGNDQLHVTVVSYNLPLWHRLGIGVEYFNYYRNAHYVEYPDVTKSIKGFRGLFSILF